MIRVAIETIQFVQLVRATIPICESINEKSLDWYNFNQIVTVAEDPVKHMITVGENIVFNGVEITADFRNAVNAFRDLDFYNFGYYLGEGMIAATMTTTDEETPLFLF